MKTIKTISEEVQDKKLLSIKNAMSNKTSDLVPVDLLQKEIILLKTKIDELVKEINTIKDALIHNDQ